MKVGIGVLERGRWTVEGTDRANGIEDDAVRRQGMNLRFTSSVPPALRLSVLAFHLASSPVPLPARRFPPPLRCE